MYSCKEEKDEERKEMKRKGGKKEKKYVVLSGVEPTINGTWSANADHYATAATHVYRVGFDKFILLSHGFTLNKNLLNHA